MSKLGRFTQKLFASNATTNQLSKYGSLAAGTPIRYSGATVTPALIQSLSNYLDGWSGAVLGNNAPAEEDMNSLFYLAFFQLAYLFQEGLPEYDAGTTYFIGSVVQSSGVFYISITDNNIGNALTTAANWRVVGSKIRSLSTTAVAAVGDELLRCDPTAAAFTVTLPAAASSLGAKMIFKNIATNGNKFTIQGNAAELIDGANTLIVPNPYDSTTLICNGTGWDTV